MQLFRFIFIKISGLLKNRFSIVVFLTIFIITSYFVYSWRWYGWIGDSWKFNICSDGRGYYAYLPAVFIDGDFGFSASKKNDHEIFGDDNHIYLQTHNEKEVDKYFIGVSILLLPFFLLSWMASLISGFPADGYSLPFQLGVSIGGIFYLFIGLYYFRKILIELHFSEIITGIVLLVLSLGTNLFQYSVMEPSMSHVYSFSIICLFLYSCSTLFNRYSFKWVLFSSFALALIILIRPTNAAVILFVPFLAGKFSMVVDLFRNLFSNMPHLAAALLLLTGIPFIQLIFYKLQTGSWFIWAYKNEGFNFSEPHFIDVLLSYKKGFFLWTPVAFLSLPGVFLIFRRNIEGGFFYLTGLIVTTYIIASWHCWSYGWSFGLRAFVEFLPFFLILFAYFLSYLEKNEKLYYSYCACSCISLIINLIQTNQYRLGILLPDSMNRDAYWEVFLKTAPKYYGYLEHKYSPPAPFEEFGDNCKTFTFDFNVLNSNEMFEVTNEKSHSAPFSVKVYDKKPYSPGLTMNSDSVFFSEKIIVNAKGWVHFESENQNTVLVVSVEDKDKQIYIWQTQSLAFFMNGNNDWFSFEVNKNVDKIRKFSDVLRVYVFNDNNSPVFLDDFIISICQKPTK